MESLFILRILSGFSPLLFCTTTYLVSLYESLTCSLAALSMLSQPQVLDLGREWRYKTKINYSTPC